MIFADFISPAPITKLGELRSISYIGALMILRRIEAQFHVHVFSALGVTKKSRWRELNPRPSAYKAPALPLSYTGNVWVVAQFDRAWPHPPRAAALPRSQPLSRRSCATPPVLAAPDSRRRRLRPSHRWRGSVGARRRSDRAGRGPGSASPVTLTHYQRLILSNGSRYSIGYV